MTASPLAPRPSGWLFLALTRDGRLADPRQLERILALVPRATDCFVFCPGWVRDEAETRREAARFFALLEGALAPLRDRVVPLRIALHWPSKPFAEDPDHPGGGGLLDELGRMPGALARPLLSRLCESEVPAGPEEAAELDGLRRRLRAPEPAAALPLSPAQALSFWRMKRRAAQVGERLGREHLTDVSNAVCTHLVGHSFGGGLATSAVLAACGPGASRCCSRRSRPSASRARSPVPNGPASTVASWPTGR